MSVIEETSITETLSKLRQVRDQIDQANAALSSLKQQEQHLERKLEDYHQQTGLDSVKGGGLTVSFAPAFRATYTPELWPEIVKWAVASGNGHIVQRRLTDAKVIELVDNGVALPEGLSLESYTKMSIRRVG
jgi:uncharacterized protein YlxW (UPF0749 family)